MGNGIRVDLTNNGPGTSIGPVNISVTYNGNSTNVTYGGAGDATWVSYGSAIDNLTIPTGVTITTYVSDPTIYPYGETVTYNLTIDPENLIAETDETNNLYTGAVATVYNGYGSKRYTDGSDIITRRTYDLNGNVIVSFGNTAYKSVSTQWTASDIPIPTGATIEDARLYSFYNWDGGEGMKNVSTDGTHAAVFNNISVPVSAHYTDRKGYGGKSGYDFPFGAVVYNVTDVFNPAGNNVTVLDSWPPLTGMVLVVMYENPTDTRKIIYLNEEFDLFYQTSGEMGMAHAPFTGPVLDTTGIKNASLITIAPHGDDRGTLYFNGNKWTKSWYYGGAQVGYNSRDVTTLVNSTGNEVIFECDGETFAGSVAILKVEYQGGSTPTLPVASFTANVTTGTAPLTVAFTDTSSNSPTSWAWDFTNDGVIDATTQNATYTYASAGTYTVNLTVANTAGSNTSVQIGCMTVTSAAGTGGLADSAWPKFQRDNNNSGLSPYVGPQTDTVLWTFTSGGSIRSSPVIGSDGTIYIGNYGDCKVYALNSNGTLKWAYTTGGTIYGAPAIGSDGTIYIGNYGDSKVYALNSDGTLKWAYTTGGIIYGAPAIGSDGTIYIGNYGDKKIYALNPEGTLKWSYTTGGSIQGSPAIGSDGTIYIGSFDSKLYALNPDGTLKWTYLTGGSIRGGSPAIGSDGTIYIGDYGDEKVYALNSDGTLKWTYTTGGMIRGSPSIGSDGTLYIGNHGDYKLYALNSDGTLKWTYNTGGSIQGSPVIGSDGTLYFGNYGDKKVNALNSDGTLKWTYTTGGSIYGSPAIGSDGTLYCGSNDKKMVTNQVPLFLELLNPFNELREQTGRSI